MRFTKSIAAAAALAVATLSLGSFSTPAQAGSNDAIIAGAAGFAVGTLFGNATARPRYVPPHAVYVAPPPRAVYVAPAPVYYVPAPWTPEWYSYCAGKYRSFDPRSGTYMGFDGYRYLCE